MCLINKYTHIFVVFYFILLNLQLRHFMERQSLQGSMMMNMIQIVRLRVSAALERLVRPCLHHELDHENSFEYWILLIWAILLKSYTRNILQKKYK